MRPELDPGMDPTALRSYYYLKDELTEFCRHLGISTAGSKDELTERIVHYLSTGTEPEHKACRKTRRTLPIAIDDEIEENITFSELHRAFFKGILGEGFRFNVRFCDWLRENHGKTYRDATAAYLGTLVKNDSIGKQFRYNTYIRDFFKDNGDRTLDDAIRCWNRKKMTDRQEYERDDLRFLEE